MFIAGGYTLTYGGNTIGQLEDGFTIRYASGGDQIRGQNLGDIIQNFVIRGEGQNPILDMVLTEYHPQNLTTILTVVNALWQLGNNAALGNGASVLGQIDYIGYLITDTLGATYSAGGAGLLAGDIVPGAASALVATKISGPNAAPTSLTAKIAVLTPGFNVDLLFAPRLRRVPISFMCLPWPDIKSTTRYPVFFTTT